MRQSLLSRPCAATLIIFATLTVTDPAVVRAQRVPDSLAFQGFLTDAGGNPIDTPSVSMTFRLYTPGVVKEQTHPSVAVEDGIFNVVLRVGREVPINAPMELGITVGDDPEITPRTLLTGALFALGMRGMYTVFDEDAPNGDQGYSVIGGSPHNTLDSGVIGGTISGGGGTHFGNPGPNSVGADWATIGGGFGNSSSGDFATVGGGVDNLASGSDATVGGGQDNLAVSGGATVGGGLGNEASLGQATVAGGSQNTASGNDATVGGGSNNTAGGSWATVPGGSNNQALGSFSFAAGRRARADHGGTWVWADSSNLVDFATTGPGQFLIKAFGGVAIGTNEPRGVLTLRGPDEHIMGPSLVLLGEEADQTESGRIRFLEGTAADNHRGAYIHYNGDGNDLHIGVHDTNDTLDTNDIDVITIERDSREIGINTSGPTRELTIFDGDNNGDSALNLRATNPGVRDLLVAVNQGTGGVISMETNNHLDLRTNGNSRLRILNTGEVGIETTTPTNPLQVGNNGGGNGNGAHVTDGGTWTDGSSRAFKEDLRPVDATEILQAVVDLPVYRWRYKESDEGDHLGPVAEDFYEAFELGSDERYIAGVDGDGVALAAIQGLFTLFEEHIERQNARIAELESRLAEFD